MVALGSNCGIDKVDVARDQKKRAKQNLMIHFDGVLIPKDPANAGEKEKTSNIFDSKLTERRINSNN